MKIFETLADVAALLGQDVASSDWFTVSQEQVNLFAQATGDHQWIHVDAKKAQAGPFGGTISHGFLTLSMLPVFFESALQIQQVRMGLNYGLNRVRFTSPVRVGSRLRAHMKLLACAAIEQPGQEQQGQQITWEVTVECEGLAKPVCVAESIVRYYP
jgi:acyl dehydratase